MQLREWCDGGDALRTAMREDRLSISQLAAMTALIDGYGVCKSTIGNLVSTGASQRNRCTQRTVSLIATALGREIDKVFPRRQ